MGACSSRPNVLDDEGRVPMPQEPAPVLEGTNEAVENVVSEKEESTLEDESEEMPTKESEAIEEPAVVEATLAAEEPNNVETPDGSNKQAETPATDEETETVEALAHTNLPTEETAQEVPSGNENPFQSFMANVTKGWGWH